MKKSHKKLTPIQKLRKENETYKETNRLLLEAEKMRIEDMKEAEQEHSKLEQKMETFFQRVKEAMKINILGEDRMNYFGLQSKIYLDEKIHSKIVEEIIKLKERVISEGKTLPYVDSTIKAENAKLWYLVRVVVGDKSIQEPHDYLKGASAFKKPDFN